MTPFPMYLKKKKKKKTLCDKSVLSENKYIWKSDLIGFENF